MQNPLFIGDVLGTGYNQKIGVLFIGDYENLPFIYWANNIIPQSIKCYRRGSGRFLSSAWNRRATIADDICTRALHGGTSESESKQVVPEVRTKTAMMNDLETWTLQLRLQLWCLSRLPRPPTWLLPSTVLSIDWLCKKWQLISHDLCVCVSRWNELRHTCSGRNTYTHTKWVSIHQISSLMKLSGEWVRKLSMLKGATNTVRIEYQREFTCD